MMTKTNREPIHLKSDQSHPKAFFISKVSYTSSSSYYPFSIWSSMELHVINNKMSTSSSTSGKKATTKSALALRQHSSPAFFFRDQNLNDFEPSAEEQPLLGFCQGNGQSHPIQCLANIDCSNTTQTHVLYELKALQMETYNLWANFRRNDVRTKRVFRNN